MISHLIREGMTEALGWLLQEGLINWDLRRVIRLPIWPSRVRIPQVTREGSLQNQNCAVACPPL